MVMMSTKREKVLVCRDVRLGAAAREGLAEEVSFELGLT